jgi:hypothetical protein
VRHARSLTAVSAADSDSDSSIDQTTNRGNKLKKRARFVHQGRLTSSMGPAAYKEVSAKELVGLAWRR